MDSKQPDNETGVELDKGDQPPIPFPTERDKDANIFQRINLAIRLNKSIEKDGKSGNGLQYDFVSHDNVTAHAKSVLTAVGVVHVPSLKSHKQDGNRVEALVENKFVNIDNPDDFFSVDWLGHGVDKQDKGPGKAASYAVKICLQKTLKMHTGEDIENHDIDYDDGQSAKVAEANEETRKAVEKWAGAYKAAIEGAPDLEKLLSIQKENKAQLASKALPEVTRTFFVELFETKKTDLA